MDISLNELKGKKNLLAFSAGIDSTALFFLLLEHHISFDIAIVNYNLRPQSKEELAYAKELAKRYNKKLFSLETKLFPSSIEEQARKVRYQFFETIIKQEHYQNLITAHQLGDQLEWFLMQLAKGAGVVELVGMERVTKKEAYTIVRPLLFVTKAELKAYLDRKGIKYFIDESNFDESFQRNYIRHNFSDPFLEKFALGVKRSFTYLLEDKKLLLPKIQKIHKLLIAPTTPNHYQNLRTIDQMFKKAGYLLSSKQKEEILKQNQGVIAGQFAFAITPKAIYVSPYKKVKLDKKTKERFRKAKIPPPLRGYIYQAKININALAQKE